MTLTKKCKHCFEHRLLKRDRFWLNKGINISTEPGRKANINKDSINRLLLASGRLISSFQENCALYAFFLSLSRILVQVPHRTTQFPFRKQTPSENQTNISPKERRKRLNWRSSVSLVPTIKILLRPVAKCWERRRKPTGFRLVAKRLKRNCNGHGEYVFGAIRASRFRWFCGQCRGKGFVEMEGGREIEDTTECQRGTDLKYNRRYPRWDNGVDQPAFLRALLGFAIVCKRELDTSACFCFRSRIWDYTLLSEVSVDKFTIYSPFLPAAILPENRSTRHLVNESSWLLKEVQFVWPNFKKVISVSKSAPILLLAAVYISQSHVE